MTGCESAICSRWLASFVPFEYVSSHVSVWVLWSVGLTPLRVNDNPQEHGLAVSIMDYVPLNLVSGRPIGTEVDYFSPVIGEYDYRAIKYGYMEVSE